MTDNLLLPLAADDGQQFRITTRHEPCVVKDCGRVVARLAPFDSVIVTRRATGWVVTRPHKLPALAGIGCALAFAGILLWLFALAAVPGFVAGLFDGAPWHWCLPAPMLLAASLMLLIESGRAARHGRTEVRDDS